MSSSINVAIPTIARDFSVLVDHLSWVITGFLISTAALLLPMGRWADLWGRRRTYMAGEALFFIATIAAGLAPDSFILIAARAVQGVSLAAIYVAYMPIILASQDRTRQGHILGITVANTYLGLSAGPFIGGFITEYTSWRVVFFFAAFIIAVSYAFIRPVKDEWYGNRHIGFNWLGAALSTVGIAALLIGLSTYTSLGNARPMLWTGTILLGLFLYHERHTRAAILPLEIFHNLTFSMSNMASLIHYSSTYAVSFLLSLHLQVILHISASLTGTIMLAQPIMMALLSPRAGALADKYGPRYVATTGITLTAAGLAIFALLPDISVKAIVLLLLLLGLGAALFGAPNNSAIMSSVPQTQQGTASSMLALARNFGQAASMSIVTLIFSHAISDFTNYEQALESGIHLTFTFLALLCTCGIILSWARGNKRC